MAVGMAVETIGEVIAGVLVGIKSNIIHKIA
jgi:hypothetical protein